MVWRLPRVTTTAIQYPLAANSPVSIKGGASAWMSGVPSDRALWIHAGTSVSAKIYAHLERGLPILAGLHEHGKGWA